MANGSNGDRLALIGFRGKFRRHRLRTGFRFCDALSDLKCVAPEFLHLQSNDMPRVVDHRFDFIPVALFCFEFLCRAQFVWKL